MRTTIALTLSALALVALLLDCARAQPAHGVGKMSPVANAAPARRQADLDAALFQAAEHGDLARVKALVAKGARPNSLDPREDMPPVLAASTMEHFDVVAYLVRQGADVNVAGIDGAPLIFDIVRRPDAALIRLLLEKGARVDARDAQGGTPLIRALEHPGGGASFAALLSGDTSQAGNTAVVTAFLEHGADPNARDKAGATPLTNALRAADGEAALLLLDHGAGPDTPDGSGATPLMLASVFAPSCVGPLLQKGADVNAHTKDGLTALMMACAVGGDGAGTVPLLLEKGADVNARGKDGSTALTAAVTMSADALAALLIQKGADVNLPQADGTTVLMAAVKAAKPASAGLVPLLLQSAAEVNAKDGKGRTALMIAAATGKTKVVKALLDKGADRSTRDGKGQTAEALAAHAHHPDVVRLLRDGPTR